MRRPAWIALALCALALASCRVAHGVHTGVVRLSAVPDGTCVEATIRATPGVTAVQSFTRQDGNERFSYWIYYAGGLGMDMRIVQKGRVIRFYNLHSRSSPMPEEERRTITALMIDVEARLAAACGMTFANAADGAS